jgi:hypothetical protein
MRDVVIVGGGCYGTFYAAQLAKARDRGRVELRRVIVVDRDPESRARRELGPAPDRVFVTAEWSAFFDDYLDAAVPGGDDYIVPSPHMPHLMFEWVLRRARQRWPGRDVAVAPVPGDARTPYDRRAPDHARYLSFAEWICPAHCIEPAVCPATGGPRDWEMSAAVRSLAERLRQQGTPVAGPALFECRHHVFGVGTFAVDAVLAGDRLLAGAGASGRPAAVLIGTVSGCHGALNLLQVGPSGNL